MATFKDEHGFIIAIIMLVLMLGAFWFWARRNFMRKQAEIELRAPLLPESGLHRLDAAMREAEEGYNACSLCGFENFKRLQFCNVCGTKIEAYVSPEEKEKAEKREKRRAKWHLLFEKKSSVELVTRPAESSTSTNHRQQRAMARKEWVRKVDVNGNVYWYRDHRYTQCPDVTGYVVRISGTVVDEGESVRPSGMKPRPERAEELREEAKHLETEFIKAAEADPMQLTLDMKEKEEHFVPDDQILTSAATNFPAKYAHFVSASASLLVPAEVEHLRFNLTRETLFDDSMETFSVVPKSHVHSVVRINFTNESGVDAGALYREWFALLNEMLVDPSNGLFCCANRDEQSFYLNPASAEEVGEEHLLYYFAIGRLIGRLPLEGYTLGFHLALPLIKIILGIPVTFDDLQYFDPDVYKSMVWIRDNSSVEDLGLDFSVMEKVGDKMVVRDMIPNGRNIVVTDENKHEYLQKKMEYLLVDSVKPQLHALLKGFYEVLPRHLLLIFDPEEFDYLLCGSDEIDVDDWERNTKHSTDLYKHPAYEWFWKLVREMPTEYRRRLLHFATGSSRPPLAGFAALTSYDGKLCPFTLKGVALVGEGYIQSHACFNRLDLPLHVVYQELKTALYTALDTELYGFTID